MKKRRKIVFILALAGALSISTISWAISYFAFIEIRVTDNPDYAPQLVTNLTNMNGQFTVKQGRAQKIDGVGLYQIDLGAPRFSDQVRINLLLLNPDEMDAVLGNPNSFIEVGVWYEAPEGTVYTGDTENIRKLDESFGEKLVIRDTGPNASKRLNERNGTILLQPSVPDKNTLYILASITVPGGVPPGQQSVGNLQFNIDVRM